MASQQQQQVKPNGDQTKAASNKDNQLDGIIISIGQFGRFQIANYILLSLPIICNAFYSISYIFTASTVVHRLVETINSRAREFNARLVLYLDAISANVIISTAVMTNPG